MQDQNPQNTTTAELPTWETPELVKADVNSATLSGGVGATDGLGTFS